MSRGIENFIQTIKWNTLKIRGSPFVDTNQLIFYVYKPQKMFTHNLVEWMLFDDFSRNGFLEPNAIQNCCKLSGKTPSFE